MRKTFEGRYGIALDMFASAQGMARAGIRARLGEVDEGEMRVQLFRQFHGSDFTPERKARIESGIRARVAEVSMVRKG